MRIVILPDGYNGSTKPFYAEPVERDGNLVKLRCAAAGMEGCVRWARESEILSAPTSPQGPLELTQGEVALHHPAPEREGEIAARESLEPEGRMAVPPETDGEPSGRAKRLDGGERPA